MGVMVRWVVSDCDMSGPHKDEYRNAYWVTTPEGNLHVIKDSQDGKDDNYESLALYPAGVWISVSRIGA